MIPENVKMTPMLEQYFHWKKKYPDCILLFRMGDFYELFFEDAKIASEVLDIVVTSRDPEKKIPMAGVPWHALNNYTAKLINAGYRLAVCDQVSEPDGRKIVDRKVTRIITAGTFLPEDAQFEAKLAAIAVRDDDHVILSTLSVGTGELSAGVLDGGRILSLLLSFGPGEILYPSGDDRTENFLKKNLPDLGRVERDRDEFDGRAGTRRLKEMWSLASLEGFGIPDNSDEAGCASALCRYLEETQFSRVDYIRGITPLSCDVELLIDRTTKKNLELVDGDSSLYSVLNLCRTPMGKRTLRHWILHPLRDISPAEKRLDAVEILKDDPSVLSSLGAALSSCSDMERSIARLSLGTGSPRDAASIRDTLVNVPDVLCRLETAGLEYWGEEISELEELKEFLDSILVRDVPRVLHQSPLVRPGFDEDLDYWRDLYRDGDTWLDNYLERERERSGIPKLKAGYNRVFGYYLEVSRTESSNVPADYIRKQTLVGSERFITEELKEFEEKILRSEEEIKKREKYLWEQIISKILANSKEIQRTGRSLGVLDVLCSFARAAFTNNYSRPSFSEGNLLKVRGGRHPVIEKFSRDIPFVPNDVELSHEDGRIAVLTGPNMAGKSTYLRMTALLVVMAQCGSFVPAESCILSPVDRIFTRIGARDELARGNSTFMLEMLETANILHNVTDDSLVILDEIGRGTSTYDGMSIAWSVIEYLHDHCGSVPKVLFATHYHELTRLADELTHVMNLSMDVEESTEGIRFLHQVVKKASDRSYGVEVARLAGVPDIVVKRSEELLRHFEDPSGSSWNMVPSSSSPVTSGSQLEMFSAEKEGIIEELASIEPDEITPLKALEILYRLSSRSRKVSGK
jgi:DNA mismatch repair protein MutS